VRLKNKSSLGWFFFPKNTIHDMFDNLVLFQGTLKHAVYSLICSRRKCEWWWDLKWQWHKKHWHPHEWRKILRKNECFLHFLKDWKSFCLKIADKKNSFTFWCKLFWIKLFFYIFPDFKWWNIEELVKKWYWKAVFSAAFTF